MSSYFVDTPRKIFSDDSTIETNHLLGEESEYSTDQDFNINNLPIPCHRLKSYIDAKKDLEDERAILLNILYHIGIKKPEQVLDKISSVQCPRSKTTKKPLTICHKSKVEWRSLFLVIVCVIGGIILLYKFTQNEVFA